MNNLEIIFFFIYKVFNDVENNLILNLGEQIYPCSGGY